MRKMYQRAFIGICFAFLSVMPGRGQSFEVTRINNKLPLITQKMFSDAGVSGHELENINGPSLIRLPDWIAPENRADSSAVYYLYFAHHQGNYIRMAWAEELEGPYHLYRVGPQYPVGQRGVLDLGSDDRIYLDNSLIIRSHIASPDVFVDDSNKQIIMYFHGPTEVPGGQKTFVSTSPYGLAFMDSLRPVVLGSSYFKVFEYKDGLYSVDNGGDLYKALSMEDPWSAPPGFDYLKGLWTKAEANPFEDDIEADPAYAGTNLRLRHSGVYVEEDTLFVFHSRKEDIPERIVMSRIIMSRGTFETWDASYPPEEILHPEETWEGADLPLLPSQGGSSKTPVNQLRDPDVYEDIDGSLYLLYTGSGEYGIGLAKLVRTYGNPVLDSDSPIEPTLQMDVLGKHSEGPVTFRIQGLQTSRFEIRIYDMQGCLLDVIRGSAWDNEESRINWYGADLARGIYIARLISKGQSVSLKFAY